MTGDLELRTAFVCVLAVTTMCRLPGRSNKQLSCLAACTLCIMPTLSSSMCSCQTPSQCRSVHRLGSLNRLLPSVCPVCAGSALCCFLFC